MRIAAITRVLLICFLTLTGVSLAFAATPPALIISDNVGNSITIDSVPTATCIGVCTTNAGPIVQPGKILWAGTLGTFTIDIVAGLSKPALAPPEISLSFLLESGSTPGTLTLKWSDTGFTGSGPATMTVAQTPTGTGSITYTSYIDGSNTLFGTGTQVGVIGPLDFPRSVKP